LNAPGEFQKARKAPTWLRIRLSNLAEIILPVFPQKRTLGSESGQIAPHDPRLPQFCILSIQLSLISPETR
jgi:hypothetical protein